MNSAYMKYKEIRKTIDQCCGKYIFLEAAGAKQFGRDEIQGSWIRIWCKSDARQSLQLCSFSVSKQEVTLTEGNLLILLYKQKPCRNVEFQFGLSPIFVLGPEICLWLTVWVKKSSPLKLFALFSLMVNLFNWKTAFSGNCSKTGQISWIAFLTSGTVFGFCCSFYCDSSIAPKT